MASTIKKKRTEDALKKFPVLSQKDPMRGGTKCRGVAGFRESVGKGEFKKKKRLGRKEEGKHV